MSEARRCTATTKAGGPCRGYAVAGGELCAGHAGLGLAGDPQRAAEAAREVQRRKAEARAREAEEARLSFRELLARRLHERREDVIRVLLDGSLTSHDKVTLVRLLDQAFGKPTERVETTETHDLEALLADPAQRHALRQALTEATELRRVA